MKIKKILLRRAFGFSATVEMTTQRTLRIKSTYRDGCLSLRHAICNMLYGIADFRRKKHGNLCSPFIKPQAKAESSGCDGIRKGKSLEAAANKISVAFYKKLRSNLLYL